MSEENSTSKHEKNDNNKLPDIECNFSDWYQEVVFKAGLCESSPVRGCIVVKPYGYKIWEEIQRVLDSKIKSMGVDNAFFPMLIPYSFIKAEKEHVSGFAPEMAIVTHAGGKELEEELVVRPTSETIIHHMFSRWIKSWRDLPFRVNQWCNVIRWEKRPRPFIRTTEFWWQEGHTAHEEIEEAYVQAHEARDLYEWFIREYLSIPVISGEKPCVEKFAGALSTFTLESMMGDGKALQMATSHVLSDTFAKSFSIEFQDKKGVLKFPQLTSWGTTTRLIGAVVMVHGDKLGLVFPPKIAPVQFIIIPIFSSNDFENNSIINFCYEIKKKFSSFGYRVVIDLEKDVKPGAKFFHWELKGVPFRIEIGKRELSTLSFIISFRDTGIKEKYTLSQLDNSFIEFLFEGFHKRLYIKASEKLKLNTVFIKHLDEIDQNKNFFYISYWCGDSSSYDLFKNYQLSVRCILDNKESLSINSCCLHKNCSFEKKFKILIAKSY